VVVSWRCCLGQAFEVRFGLTMMALGGAISPAGAMTVVSQRGAGAIVPLAVAPFLDPLFFVCICSHGALPSTKIFKICVSIEHANMSNTVHKKLLW
jgi:hypothetical protein